MSERKQIFFYRCELVREILRRGSVVTAQQIGTEIGAHERSVYRYIDELRRSGMRILSGYGVGYLYKEQR